MQSFNDETVVTRFGQLQGFEEQQPSILVMGGPAVGKQVMLDSGKTVWGRARDADVFIADESISRYQFMIEVKGRVAIIRDLNSTNGTYVNGHRIEEHVLEPNDKIQISSATVMRFSYIDPIDKDAHRRIYEMALYDPATQAHTKRYFLDHLLHEFAHSDRKKRPLSLIMFDLDHFKHINDTYGHPAGDFVLQQVCDIVRPMIRLEDIFSRYGGEEFVVLMRDCSEKESKMLAERIRSKIEEAQFVFEDKAIPVTVSLGVSSFYKKNLSRPEDLIKTADEALYNSKEKGRNRVSLWGAF